MKKIMFVCAVAAMSFTAVNVYSDDSMEKMRGMELPADINFYRTSDGGAMGRELVNSYMAMEVDPVVDSVLKLNQFCLDEGIINRALFTAIRGTYLDMLRRMATQQMKFMDFKGTPEELQTEMRKAKSMMDEAKKSFTEIQTDLTLKMVRYKLTRIEKGMESDIKFLDEMRKRIAGL